MLWKEFVIQICDPNFRPLYLLSFKLNMLTWEGDQCFIVSTFAQNHGAWPKKNRQRSVPERYGFAFLPGSFKPVQNSPKLCCVKFMDFIVETKTSKDSGWFPKLFFAKTQVFQWYLPLGYGQLLQDHSEAFCFGPLAIKWSHVDDVVNQRNIFSSQSIAMVGYGWL